MEILNTLNDVLWGAPMLLAFMLSGLWLTIKLRGIQLRRLGLSLALIFKKEHGSAKGDVSSFQALCTALSASVGTGNIVGVATALTAGGPGALLWMCAAAFVGMATKFAESTLAVKYRSFSSDGSALGGPFAYIERGLGLKWLAKLFAFFGSCAAIMGIGTMVQSNSMAEAAKALMGDALISQPVILGQPAIVACVAVITAVLAALIISGGVKRIGRASAFLVPIMSIAYVAALIAVIVSNFERLPQSLSLIVSEAFSLRAAGGGALGSVMMAAMRAGVARGVFSNEAGMGSGAIASAAARTKWPARQGLIDMSGVFIDTIVMCSLTGLALVMTGAYESGLEGVAMSVEAFNRGIPNGAAFGVIVVAIGLITFGFATIIGWNYYGESCFTYFAGKKRLKAYRFLYIASVIAGPFISLGAVWSLADIANALMALPNLYAVFMLSPIVILEAKRYFSKSPLP